MSAAEIDFPAESSDAVFREQQVAESVLTRVVVDIRRLAGLVEAKADETMVGRQPQVTPTVLSDGEDTVASEVIVAIFSLKAVTGSIVEEETAAVGDGPQPSLAVLQAVGGVVDGKVALLRSRSYGHGGRRASPRR